MLNFIHQILEFKFLLHYEAYRFPMEISGDILLYSHIKCSIGCPLTKTPIWFHLWAVIKLISVLKCCCRFRFECRCVHNKGQIFNKYLISKFFYSIKWHYIWQIYSRNIYDICLWRYCRAKYINRQKLENVLNLNTEKPRYNTTLFIANISFWTESPCNTLCRFTFENYSEGRVDDVNPPDDIRINTI
jgi:hypothetical protein